jgi:YD repeat-containing protein
MTETRRGTGPIFWRVLVSGAVLVFLVGSCAGSSDQDKPAKEIPNGWLYPLVPQSAKFIRYHPQDYSAPIAHVALPQHPFMAPHAGNNMHCDAYMSDAYEASGPRGLNSKVTSRTQGFGGYGTLGYDSQGRLIAVHSNGGAFQLELMDPYTLEELASYDLPSRPWYWILQGVLPWEYLGAGMYFYLDNEHRAIVPTTKNTLQVVQAPDPEGGEGFKLVREYDLADHVVPMRWPKGDSVAWVLPDWSGRYYWYATTGGMVGTIEVASGVIHTKRLEGELIENSFAVGEDGVYILSDRALYRFSADGDGNVVVDWRTEYDRGPGQKPGHITRGSGTSVTLAGGLDGLVVIADNAEPRIHLLFVQRSDGGVMCSTPVFEAGKSGTDVSTVGFEQADGNGVGTGVYSVLIENNWGHHTFPRSRPEPGLTRVDAARHPDGTYSCGQVWASEEKSIGVFKLSLGNGLAYMYWRSEGSPITQWYVTAVDFRTGETVYKQLTGTGLGYNNWAGALFLHPDGKILYSTTIFGLVMMQDTAS